MSWLSLTELILRVVANLRSKFKAFDSKKSRKRRSHVMSQLWFVCCPTPTVLFHFLALEEERKWNGSVTEAELGGGAITWLATLQEKFFPILGDMINCVIRASGKVNFLQGDAANFVWILNYSNKLNSMVKTWRTTLLSVQYNQLNFLVKTWWVTL